MRQKKTLLVLSSLLFVLLLTNAYAVNFEAVNLYSYFNVYDPITFPSVATAQGMQVVAITDSNLYPVRNQFNTTNPVVYDPSKPNFPTNYLPKWSNLPIYPTGSIYIASFPFNSPWKYQNVVFFIDTITNGTYDNVEPLTYILPRLSGSYQFLNAAQNVQISGGIYPTITWDPVTEAELYRVGIVGFDANGNPYLNDLKFVTDFLTSTSYTYSGSPLQYGQPYAFFVEARDYLNNDASNPLINLVNQSRYLTEYTPAVPVNTINATILGTDFSVPTFIGTFTYSLPADSVITGLTLFSPLYSFPAATELFALEFDFDGIGAASLPLWPTDTEFFLGSDMTHMVPLLTWDGSLDLSICCWLGTSPSMYTRVSGDYWTLAIDFEPSAPLPVPEPSTMLLLGSVLIGLAGYGRKKFFKK